MEHLELSLDYQLVLLVDWAGASSIFPFIEDAKRNQRVERLLLVLHNLAPIAILVCLLLRLLLL